MTIKEKIYSDLEDFDSDEEKIQYLKDVLENGCQSGIVSDLIYYKDTNKFFDDFEEEIEDLISYFMEELDIKTRPLFIEGLNGNAENITQEKNLLCWFAYEELSRRILTEDFKIEY